MSGVNVGGLRLGLCLGFFFSSRRRHTGWPRDLVLDVCSSDLPFFFFFLTFYFFFFFHFGRAAGWERV